jgi:hypothetical protein
VRGTEDEERRSVQFSSVQLSCVLYLAVSGVCAAGSSPGAWGVTLICPGVGGVEVGGNSQGKAGGVTKWR